MRLKSETYCWKNGKEKFNIYCKYEVNRPNGIIAYMGQDIPWELLDTEEEKISEVGLNPDDTLLVNKPLSTDFLYFAKANGS